MAIGGTFNHVGEPVNPDEGYAIGIRSFPSLRAAFEAATPRHHVGYWVDEATDTAYYDLVAIVDEEEHAVAMGRKYGQIAIWSFRNNQEIRLTNGG